MKDQVIQWIDKNRYAVVEFLGELIAYPSVTGDEGEIQDYIAGRLRGMGLMVNMWEPDLEELKRHPAFVSVSQGYKGRPNVVGILNGRGGGRSLLINGHVDVIPAGAPESWTHYPWSGDVAEGKVYGRGASDMKGGLAAMTMAVEAIHQVGVRLKGDLTLEYTVDEELSGNGTLACVLKGYRADAGICCETSSMKVQPASVGRIWFEVRVAGKAAGIQRRWEGVNAIDKGYRVVRAVSDFEQERIGRLHHPLYPDVRGAIPCMVGVFNAGTYASAFPDSCLLKGSLATLPGEDSSAVKEEFVRFVRNAVSDDPWLKEYPPEVSFVGYFAEPSELSPRHSIVQTLCNKFREVAGRDPEISGREGAADIRFLNRYGETPTVIFGPGMTEQMHANNEWVAIDDLILATKILAVTILEWCQVA